jgi:hypothetical protein
MQMTFEAKDFEATIDDDEGPTALFVRCPDIGGYLSISRDGDDSRLYCECCDQSNGFYSETICLLISGNRVNFKLSDAESFSRAELIQEINITFQKDMNEVISCIDALRQA